MEYPFDVLSLYESVLALLIQTNIIFWKFLCSGFDLIGKRIIDSVFRCHCSVSRVWRFL